MGNKWGEEREAGGGMAEEWEKGETVGREREGEVIAYDQL